MQIYQKFFMLLFAGLLFSLAATTLRAEEYKVISPAQPTRTGEKIEVLEIFWYGCPHCYSFEPHLERWKENIAEDVEFRRMPAVLNRSWMSHARTYFATEKMGVLDTIHTPLFEALHKKRERIFSRDEIAEFLAGHGIDKNEFIKVYESNETETRMKEAFIMAQRYKITGVPAVVVNGKYLTSPSMTGSYEKILEVIDMLVEMER